MKKLYFYGGSHEFGHRDSSIFWSKTPYNDDVYAFRNGWAIYYYVIPVNITDLNQIILKI